MVLFRLYKKIKKITYIIKVKYYTFFVKYKAAECKGRLMVIHRSSVSSNTYLGHNVNFQGMIISGKGKVTIGDNFHSGRGCTILSHYHNYDSGTKIPYDNTYIVQDVTIGDNVWLGINVTILSGVNIGEGAIIQAGSVVVNDIPPLAIAGGHPAKVFKYRNKEHYYKLKSEKKFH